MAAVPRARSQKKKPCHTEALWGATVIIGFRVGRLTGSNNGYELIMMACFSVAIITLGTFRSRSLFFFFCRIA